MSNDLVKSKYRVKKMFGPTIQGEGFHSGLACVFLRFASCNLACTWCDTDFNPAGAPFLTASEITTRLLELDSESSRTVIVTGGEPALQWDSELAFALKSAGFRVHMETNGTTVLAAPVDWLTVSPKPQFHPKHLGLASEFSPDECKVVVDGSVDEDVLDGFEKRYRCEHWFLQPCDDGSDDGLSRVIALVTSRPRWRLSVQLHKIVGVP